MPRRRFKTPQSGHKKVMAKGDFVEVLVDAGSGAAREYIVEATKAGRTVEVRSSRTTVEVRELTRTGGVVRTARFIATGRPERGCSFASTRCGWGLPAAARA